MLAPGDGGSHQRGQRFLITITVLLLEPDGSLPWQLRPHSSTIKLRRDCVGNETAPNPLLQLVKTGVRFYRRNEQTMKIFPVILSGGAGTRLWPLSREFYPKPLLPITVFA